MLFQQRVNFGMFNSINGPLHQWFIHQSAYTGRSSSIEELINAAGIGSSPDLLTPNSWIICFTSSFVVEANLTSSTEVYFSNCVSLCIGGIVSLRWDCFSKLVDIFNVIFVKVVCKSCWISVSWQYSHWPFVRYLIYNLEQWFLFIWCLLYNIVIIYLLLRQWELSTTIPLFNVVLMIFTRLVPPPAFFKLSSLCSSFPKFFINPLRWFLSAYNFAVSGASSSRCYSAGVALS